ncbi:MAG: hypothetical protein LBL00_04725 [Endomicrobium sp.]|jgi:predicted nucleotidyltransferase|nr:hypothetical protein [Endomicrobium sp.]
MDIFQQEKRNFSEMQALQVAANVSRRLSELLGREIDIEFKKSYRFYPPGTYNLRKKFKKYEKFTVYRPKIAL